MTPTEAIAVLENRCRAIDAHYARFPNTVERTMEETAKAVRVLVQAYNRKGSEG